MKKHEILLIDDDQITNFVNKKFIESEFPDFPILVFENGQRAIEYIRENKNGSFLIFLDINMPIMNGWEFLEALKSDGCPYDISLHILTSSYEVDDKNRAKANNLVTSFVTKPLTKDKLKDFKSQFISGCYDV